MTKIEWFEKAECFLFKCEGHCNHDVCTAVTALTNALVQWAEDKESKGMCALSEEYKSGTVKLELFFVSTKEKKIFLKEVSALLGGFELYQANFPHHVKCLGTTGNFE